MELMPNPHVISLSMREADIAVRLVRSEQHDLVVRRIGQIAFGLYASPVYLEQHGEPDFEAGCPGHRLMTLLDDVEIDPQAQWLSDLGHGPISACRRAATRRFCPRRGAAGASPVWPASEPIPDPACAASRRRFRLRCHRDFARRAQRQPRHARVRVALLAIAEAVKGLAPASVRGTETAQRSCIFA